jgi:sugar lactone lactonase YvrE
MVTMILRRRTGTGGSHDRSWAATLADAQPGGGGVLYRLDRDRRVEQGLDGLTMANGTGWSPDGATMCFADSGPDVLRAFHFGGDTGTFTHGGMLGLAEAVGAADGLTVDVSGDLWAAT